MKERPIIFNDAMVQALLAGRKTQTRRVIKPQPSGRSNHIWSNGNQFAFCEGTHDKGAKCEEDSVIKTPYGVPGDRLWVREIFVLESNFGLGDVDGYEPPFKDGHPVKWEEAIEWGRWWSQPHYRATDPKPDLVCEGKDGPACIWRPQLYMPRWASRILLEVTDVHVERLNDMMPESIIKEGPPDSVYFSEDPKAPLEWFHDLWDSINKKKPGRSWEDNPWVWVITFRRM